MTIATAVAAAASRIHQRKAGNIASRNAVVSRSTIMTSTKSIVIQSLSNLKRDSSVSATRISREISAATVGLRSKASHRQLSMTQTSRKTAMPTRPTSVVTMRSSAPACSDSTRQSAAILPRPALFMPASLARSSDAPWNIVHARPNLVPRTMLRSPAVSPTIELSSQKRRSKFA